MPPIRYRNRALAGSRARAWVAVIGCIALVAGLLFGSATPALAADCTYTQNSDFNTQTELQTILDGGCAGGTMIINFGAGFTLATNPLAWTQDTPLQLVGQSATESVLDGNDAVQIVSVTGLGALTVASLTLRKGKVVGTSGNGSVASGSAFGGAIKSSAAVTITDSTLANNTVTGGSGIGTVSSGSAGSGGAAAGGAIYSSSTVSISGSTFTSNTATGGNAVGNSALATPGVGGAARGGAVYGNGVTVTSTSTFTANKADGGGGTITTGAGAGGAGGVSEGGTLYSASTVDLTSASITGTTCSAGPSRNGAGTGAGAAGAAARGCGVYASGAATLTNSSISGAIATASKGGNAGSSATTGNANGGSANGGGLYANTVSITGGSIVNNKVIAGAAGTASNSSQATSGSAYGGGVYANTAAAPTTVTNATFSGNVASGASGVSGGTSSGAYGGALYTIGTVAISGSTFTSNEANGAANSPTTTAGAGGASRGGAISSVSGSGSTINNSTFTTNKATGGAGGKPTTSGTGGSGGAAWGGAVYVAGTLTATSSTFSGNSITGGAGGIGPTINGGTGGAALGGAIYSTGSQTLTSSTISANSATSGKGGNATTSGNGGSSGTVNGGGSYISSGSGTMTNSTLTANTITAGSGGTSGTGTAGSPATPLGGGAYGTWTVNFSTVYQNLAVKDTTDVAGGAFGSTGTLTTNGSIIATTTGSVDACASFTTKTANYSAFLTGDTSCGTGDTNQSFTDAQLALGSLADNGGTTKTLLPAETSSVIGMVPSSVGAGLTPAVTTDQRGYTRGGDMWSAGSVQRVAQTTPLNTTVTQDPVAFNTTSTLSTTGGDGTGTVSYTVDSGSSAMCSVSGANGETLTALSGAGTCTVNATKAADSQYASQTAPVTVDLSKASQASLDVTAADSSIQYLGITSVSASGGSSGGAISYSVNASSSSICSLSGANNDVVTGNSPGSCVIDATMAGNTNYNDVNGSVTITVSQADQAALTISPTAGSTLAYNDSVTVNATGGTTSGAITYVLSQSNPCTLDATTHVLTATSATGTCTVTATLAGNDDYNDVSAVTTVILTKADQPTLTISPPISSSLTYNTSVTVTATGGRPGGTIAYELSNGDPCAFNTATRVLTATAGTGTCTVTATKPGNNSYNSINVVTTLNLTKANQDTFTASASPTTIAYGSTSTLSTSGGSGTGGVTYAVDGPSISICSLSGANDATVTGDAPGSCVINATKAADANYDEATSSVTISVGKADQATLTVTAADDTIHYLGATTVSTAGGSGTGAVTYAVDGTSTSICSLSGINNDTVTGDAPGVCIINATKAGDSTYNQANATTTITVTKAGQAVLTAIPSSNPITVGSTTTILTLGGSGTGTVRLSVDNESTGICSVTGTIVRGTTVGTCTINVLRDGDTNYNSIGTTTTVAVRAAAQTQATGTPSPKRIRNVGATLLLSRGTRTNTGAFITARVSVKIHARGDVRYYRIIRNRVGLWIRTFGRPLTIKVTYTAPAAKGYPPYRKVMIYRTK